MRSTSSVKKYWLAGIALLIVGSVLGTFFVGGTLPARAQPPGVASSTSFIYSVKFACVNEVGPAAVVGIEAPFEPAAYRTAINVYNFHDEPVELIKKAVIARSEDEEPGISSAEVVEVLQPGKALFVDCIDVSELLYGAGQLGNAPIGDGFVIIESDVELDVVAVYTSTFVDEVGHRNLELWNKIIFEIEVPEGREIPLPIPRGATGEVVVQVGEGVADVDKLARDAIDEELVNQGNPPLPPDVPVKIKSVEFGVGKGVGIGLSAGHSIDVEYIEPKIVRHTRK
jgi:hypothetical protein